MLRNIIILLAFGIFTFTCYSSYNLYHQVKSQKAIKEDYAAINMITYGLFDIQLWKEKALGIFKKNIEDYEINPSAYEALDRQLQRYLGGLYKRYFESGEFLEIILDKMTESGGINKMFVAIIQKNLSSQLSNLNLEKEIPGLSSQLINEIKRNEPQIKAYFQAELMSMVMEDVQAKLSDRREPFYEKYGFDNYEETNNHLTAKISDFESKLKPQIVQNIALLSFLLLLIVFSYRILGFKMMILGLTLLSVVLLLLGITLPMIDIDARLNAFSISLMGEPISFEEQIVYFRASPFWMSPKLYGKDKGWI